MTVFDTDLEEFKRFDTIDEWAAHSRLHDRNPATRVVIGYAKVIQVVRDKRGDETFQPYFDAAYRDRIASLNEHRPLNEIVEERLGGWREYQVVELELLECGHWMDANHILGLSTSRRCHKCESQLLLRTEVGRDAEKFYAAKRAHEWEQKKVAEEQKKAEERKKLQRPERPKRRTEPIQ